MYTIFRILDNILWPIRALGYYAGRLVPGVKKVVNVTPALQAAIIAFVFLLIASIITAWMQGFTNEVTIGKYPYFIGATLLFPIMLYFGITLVLTPSKSLYPDIDDAWEAGIEALEEQGLPIKSLPLFLVVGAGAPERLNGVFRGSGLDLELDGVVKGAAPLRWYATADAIYLCCPTVGVVSRLIESASSGAPVARARPSKRPTETAVAFDQTLEAPDAFDDPSAFLAPAPSPMAGMMGRTIDLEDVLGDTSGKQKAYDSPSKRAGGLTAAQVRQERGQLTYLCQLINRSRNPVCPVNGILMILPFHSVLLADSQTESAVQDDLAIIRSELQLRCTTIVMVSDMEREPGFLELIRRVGGQLAASGRFGKGFDRRTPPTKERLEAFSQHACGSFEDWTHKLFGDKGALEKPGNGQLFATMCKVRGRFRKVFSSTLSNGFGIERSEESPDSLMFGGCYFAATGDKPGTQGFVSAIFSKLAQVEDDLEWMTPALAHDERCRAAANFALLAGIAAVAVAGYAYSQGMFGPMS